MTGPLWWRRRPGLRGTTRRITVGSVTWRVFEFLCPFDAPGEGSLIFVSDNTWRRVRKFPSDWAARTDVDLYAVTKTG